MRIEMPSAVSDPVSSTRPLGSDSVRLTSHIDIEPRGDSGLLLTGAGRELRASPGAARTLSSATLQAEVGRDRVLRHLEVSPAEDRVTSLVGREVGRGFRASTRALFEESAPAVPLVLLLDDLPMAVLISGYAALYNGEVKIDASHLRAGVLRSDICSGWRSDGTMLTTLRTRGRLPLPLGPPATRHEDRDDPLAWHEMPEMAEQTMRRRRLIEISGADPVDVYATFRDTHTDSEGLETILHEYEFSARLDRASKTLSGCEAEPRVLPWPECPAAAASARMLDGSRIDELSRFVPEHLRGTTTCTHLNDLLRTLSTVDLMLVHLAPSDGTAAEREP